MKMLHFKDFFWSSDLTCTGGYDIIIQYLNDGRRTCKEVVEFIRARASIEEKYAKELLGLSKKVCGHNEMNTLKRSLDIFKLQTEHVSLSHLQLAHSMREEAKKLEIFREKQKEAKKKVEQHMEVLHKHKCSQLKRTMESKRTYEQKCKDKEEAEQNVNRCGSSSIKHMDKLCAKAQQAKVNAEEADRLYRQSVISLAKIREDWLKEHIQACEVFEQQAADRISFVRNTIWTHLNLLSQRCVSQDELNEDVRKSLEKCDIQEDIEHFVKLRRTGEKPPAPVLYENFYSGQRVPPLLIGACPSPRTDNRSDAVNSHMQDAGYSVVRY
uniref:proline-serine-threonine phosphatase-interacting protein 2 isoform X2 n=1 Tax=Doryrhamphus excisus TaxID=161450 RepID=UPI0025AE96CF|nr:proline-serine-threonine phosphatase-interacting protein 2 isoform X2 [Doryrhamphus excisus]